MGKVLPLLLMALGLSACAHSPSYDPSDPLEKINRPIFQFNLKADKYVLQPVARTYVKVLPSPARKGVSNFFDNLFYPTTIVNDLLQAKFRQGAKDTIRFVMNSTVGLLGFIDVATGQGLPLNNEDLGQTFGRWGVGPGWYLMLPLLGPSTNRDLLGFVGDNWAFQSNNPTNPLNYVDSLNFVERLAITGVGIVDDRSEILGSEKILEQQLDPYVFFRTVYLDRRTNLVYDGKPPEEVIDFGDEDEATGDDATPPDAEPRAESEPATPEAP